MQRPEIRTEHIAHFQQWLEGDALSGKAKLRLRCILRYLESDAPMADVAAEFGTTSNALSRWLSQFDPTDPSSLEEKSRRAHTVRTSQLPDAVVALIREYRTVAPKMGKEEIVVKLLQEHGVQASASAVGRVIERHCLYFADSPLHMRKRLQAQLSQAPALTMQGVAEVSPVQHAPTAIKPKAWLVSTLFFAMLALSLALGYGLDRKTADAAQTTHQPSVAGPQFNPATPHVP